MTPKISKAEMSVLKRMATGEEINRNGLGVLWIGVGSDPQPVNTLLFGALQIYELIEHYSPGKWRITDTGRSLVEQEAAKEVGA